MKYDATLKRPLCRPASSSFGSLLGCGRGWLVAVSAPFLHMMEQKPERCAEGSYDVLKQVLHTVSAKPSYGRTVRARHYGREVDNEGFPWCILSTCISALLCPYRTTALVLILGVRGYAACVRGGSPEPTQVDWPTLLSYCRRKAFSFAVPPVHRSMHAHRC